MSKERIYIVSYYGCEDKKIVAFVGDEKGARKYCKSIANEMAEHVIEVYKKNSDSYVRYDVIRGEW